MILRLKGIITHNHKTKLLGDCGEDVAIGWGIRPSPKAKPFEEDPKGIQTLGWGKRPNPGKDPTLTHGWGNKPKPKKDPARVEV